MIAWILKQRNIFPDQSGQENFEFDGGKEMEFGYLFIVGVHCQGTNYMQDVGGN